MGCGGSTDRRDAYGSAEDAGSPRPSASAEAPAPLGARRVSSVEDALSSIQSPGARRVSTVEEALSTVASPPTASPVSPVEVVLNEADLTIEQRRARAIANKQRRQSNNPSGESSSACPPSNRSSESARRSSESSRNSGTARGNSIPRFRASDRYTQSASAPDVTPIAHPHGGVGRRVQSGPALPYGTQDQPTEQLRETSLDLAVRQVAEMEAREAAAREAAAAATASSPVQVRLPTPAEKQAALRESSLDMALQQISRMESAEPSPATAAGGSSSQADAGGYRETSSEGLREALTQIVQMESAGGSLEFVTAASVARQNQALGAIHSSAAYM